MEHSGTTTKGAEIKKCLAANSHGETRLDHVDSAVKAICLCAVIDATSTAEIANNIKKQIVCAVQFGKDVNGGSACLSGICPSLQGADK